MASAASCRRRVLSLASRSLATTCRTLFQSLAAADVAGPPSPSPGPLPFQRDDARPFVASPQHSAFVETYNRQRQKVPLNHMVPQVATDAWVAPNAVLIGGVTVQDKASVWYSAVLRADLNYITVGYGSNIQDKVVISTVSPSPGSLPTETVIGRSVTVGQGSVLQSCEIEDEAIIGQRCIVPRGCLVEKNAILSDGTVLTEGQLIPGGQLWAGNPAKFVRDLTADEKAGIPGVAAVMNTAAGEHASEFLPFSSAYIEKEKLEDSLKASAEKKKNK